MEGGILRILKAQKGFMVILLLISCAGVPLAWAGEPFSTEASNPCMIDGVAISDLSDYGEGFEQIAPDAQLSFETPMDFKDSGSSSDFEQPAPNLDGLPADDEGDVFGEDPVEGPPANSSLENEKELLDGEDPFLKENEAVETPGAYFSTAQPESEGVETLAGERVSIKSGLYSIASAMNQSLVLDISSSSPLNGAFSCLWERNEQANQVFYFQQQSDGLYIIRAFHSDKVLAVSGLSAKNGASVVQWTDNGTLNMRWEIQSVNNGAAYRIVSAETGLCLDFASSSASKGAQFVAWEITGSEKQTFNLTKADKKESAGATLEEGIYHLALSDDESICIGSTQIESSVPNGTGLVTQEQKSQLSQKYSLTYHDTDGFYTITHLGSGKVLAVSGIESKKGAAIVLWGDNGTANMRWSIEKVVGGYKLVSKETALVFDFSANNAELGATCVVWESTGASKQVFSLRSAFLVEDGFYSISPVKGSNYYVDINGSSISSGAQAILWTKNGGFSQKYHFSRSSDGTYTIKTLHSNQQVGVSSSGKIVQLPAGTSSSQRWVLKPDGCGNIRLETQADDGSIRAFSTGGNIFSSATVWGQWKDASSLDQSFSFVPVSLLDDGLYTIAAASNTQLIMSQRNASGSNGTSVNFAKNGGLPWSQYLVKNVSVNVVNLVTASGKALAVDVAAGNGAVVVQWDNSGADNMKWEVVADYQGSVYLTNVATGQNIDYASDAAAVGDNVVAWSAHFGSKQRWKFIQAEKTNEAQAYYDLSVSTMLSYQMSNPWTTETWQQVLSYLDPSQLKLKNGGYYTFADIRGYTGMSAAQLDGYIESTSAGRSGNLRGMGAYFVSAAKKYNLNEMYLLAHAIIESGWGTSDLASGYSYDGLIPINGKTYPVGKYYNFYGIGAVDSSPLSGGRSLAIQNGWNSPKAAIEGAALWIAVNYINRADYPQVTLYDMRWDPARSVDTHVRSWHQYATSITWASSIGRVMELGYEYNDVTPQMTFIVPSYK